MHFWEAILSTDTMENLQILYAVAIGIGFGGIAFVITYQLFTLIQKKGLLGRGRRQQPAAW
jgi:Trk-type K+ transport system membrane component